MGQATFSGVQANPKNGTGDFFSLTQAARRVNFACRSAAGGRRGRVTLRTVIRSVIATNYQSVSYESEGSLGGVGDAAARGTTFRHEEPRLSHGLPSSDGAGKFRLSHLLTTTKIRLSQFRSRFRLPACERPRTCLVGWGRRSPGWFLGESTASLTRFDGPPGYVGVSNSRIPISEDRDDLRFPPWLPAAWSTSRSGGILRPDRRSLSPVVGRRRRQSVARVRRPRR